jgi:hypothetical protein
VSAVSAPALISAAFAALLLFVWAATNYWIAIDLLATILAIHCLRGVQINWRWCVGVGAVLLIYDVFW